MEITRRKMMLSALRGSIQKWQDIVDRVGEDYGANNCPLCKLFINSCDGEKLNSCCSGCPVKKFTGKVFCKGTPYEDWSENNFHTVLYIDDDGDKVEEEINILALSLAQQELDFLEMLLKKELENESNS